MWVEQKPIVEEEKRKDATIYELKNAVETYFNFMTRLFERALKRFENQIQLMKRLSLDIGEIENKVEEIRNLWKDTRRDFEQRKEKLVDTIANFNPKRKLH